MGKLNKIKDALEKGEEKEKLNRIQEIMEEIEEELPHSLAKKESGPIEKM